MPQVAIRCPTKGCLLATIYDIPRTRAAKEIETGQGGGSYYNLYVGHTPAGHEVWDIINYACTCDQALYWRAGCRCGTASLDRAWMTELFTLADRLHHRIETEEEFVAKLPVDLRKFWGKRVFHPEPSAWHPR